MTTMTAAIFVFTSLVFVTYDCLVARRQKVVMNRVNETGRIVSSLFPAQVRKQLYEEQQANIAKEKKRAAFQAPAPSDGSLDGGTSHTKQIADEYNECTIFFADLKGYVIRITGRCWTKSTL